MPPIAHRRGTLARLAGWLALAGSLVATHRSPAAESPPVRVGRDGTLAYATDGRGNRVPDFSHCGYTGADRAIPDVPVRVVVEPANGDDGRRIQAALEHVARLPIGDDGFRGAVLLQPGVFEIAGQLRMSATGVVLRGSGADEGGTTLVATGTDRRALIRIAGRDDRLLADAVEVVDDYVPVGAKKLRVASTAYWQPGQAVLVTRPSSAAWIERLDARQFGVGWRVGSRDLCWDRRIVALDGQSITLDAPITTAIERPLGGATVAAYRWPGRIEHLGVEDLRLESAYDPDRPHDEDHGWFGITIDDAQDVWVRRVAFGHFAGGAVALWEGTRRATVEDCLCREPVSEIGGYRRHTFFNQGQLSLFLRCWSEQGRHDFAVGHAAPGPNAFVNCYAAEALADSGPIESWAAGVLYDNVRVDGHDLRLTNRWADPPRAGWSAANCVLWQCRAAHVECFRPPGANNWAVGCWANFAGDGTFFGRSDFVRPQSLYQAQLEERLGQRAAAQVEPILGRPESATNPSLEEAAEFVARSHRPARPWSDVIEENFRRAGRRLRQQPPSAETLDRLAPPEGDTTAASDAGPSPPPAAEQPLALRDGRLVVGDTLLAGGELRAAWWRGTVRPEEAASFGPSIARFVPGRVGTGFTDHLPAVADAMVAAGQAAYEHHYGLWYDRRRDDHLMVRRADGDVAPPFYEQPFARSGRGTAWDGLSRYDLTRFNPWYWNRLGDFARLCDRRGLVLLHQHYFQHNILEAGAHWADSPWRPANHVNHTGLPEPPPYIGDKRVFLAPAFYDVADARLRALHRGYIRQCLDNFADCTNVLHLTSGEYSGPLEFTRFWLDTLAQWEADTGHDALVCLSAPKNVQDVILADPQRAAQVEVIDIRYWAYTAGGELYAPDGGLNLAPRQHRRQTAQKSGGAAAVVRACREYRQRFPDKAVLYHAADHCPSARDGWAVLVGGGSLPDVALNDALARVIPSLQPADGILHGDAWCLAGEAGDGQHYLAYAADGRQTLELQLPGERRRYAARWIDPRTGDVIEHETVVSDASLRLPAKSNVLWLHPTRGE